MSGFVADAGLARVLLAVACLAAAASVGCGARQRGEPEPSGIIVGRQESPQPERQLQATHASHAPGDAPPEVLEFRERYAVCDAAVDHAIEYDRQHGTEAAKFDEKSDCALVEQTLREYRTVLEACRDIPKPNLRAGATIEDYVHHQYTLEMAWHSERYISVIRANTPQCRERPDAVGAQEEP